MFDRIMTPIIAIALALLAWLYTRSRDEEMLDRYEIPVEIQLAASQLDMYDLEASGPSHVRVSFTGPPSRIREVRHMLQRGEVKVKRSIAVPDERLNDARFVDVVRLDASEVPVLPGVHAIIPENQDRITVTLRRIIEKRLPVRLNHTADDRIEQIVVEPSTVTVRGHKEILERQEYLPTQLYTAPATPGATEPLVMETPEPVGLVQELEGRPMRVTPPLVSVRFTLKPRQKIFEAADVPVHFLCPPNFPLRPQFTAERDGKVALKITGPAGEDRPAVAAYIDLTARNFGPGLHAEEPIRVQLPPGFQITGQPPRVASFQLVPMDMTPKPAAAAFPP